MSDKDLKVPYGIFTLVFNEYREENDRGEFVDVYICDEYGLTKKLF